MCFCFIVWEVNKKKWSSFKSLTQAKAEGILQTADARVCFGWRIDEVAAESAGENLVEFYPNVCVWIKHMQKSHQNIL